MIDEATLRHLYLDEKRSIRAIAILTQMPVHTVRELLGQYQIPRRTAGFQPAHPAPTTLDEATLRRMYLEDMRSIREIATSLDLSTRSVYDALVRYRIPRRSGGYRRTVAPAVSPEQQGTLTETTLRRLYEQNGESIASIAQSLGCPPSRVRDALVRWNIPRRRRGRRYGTV
ncbi:hypothetical protein SE17_07730 [Kouleothrix aurantiaca]|jgi:transposase-like protein|uniref:Uncharacterized protein n=1 Tax=Kouleothrix aurantiaca TaxID=186479 RepID=A0A0P9D3U6_9CHLR|nr:hypothetical protein SE17_07730 [Kouleothrix aurantiaca]